MASTRYRKDVDIHINFKQNASGLNEITSTVKDLAMKLNSAINSNGSTGNWLKNSGLSHTELTKAYSDVQAILSALTKSQNIKIGFNSATFTKELNSAGLSITSVQNRLVGLGASGQQAWNQITTAIMNTKIQVRQTSKVLDDLSRGIYNSAKWAISNTIINSISNTLRKSVDYVKNLDTSLNKIRAVTSKSREEMDAFAVSANKAALSLNKSTLDYTDAALTFYQQGLSDKEVKARTDTTLKASNITGQDTTTMADQLTAVWNGYKVAAEDTEKYVDKMSAVSASTASNLQELSTGMARTASAAHMMGVDIDQLNGILSTITSTTRLSSESIGTSVRTILSRLADLKLGGEDEDGVTLGKVSGALDSLGIHILDANKNLRDMGTVIEEVGDKWNSNVWNDAQKTAIAIQLAGTRQYSNLVALFDAWDKYKKAVDVSANATGTLAKQQAIYSESVQAHAQDLRTVTQKLYGDLLDSKAMKFFIDWAKNAVDLLDKFTKSLGGGIGALGGFLSLLTSLLSNQISQGVTRMVENFGKSRANEERLYLQNVMVNSYSKMNSKIPYTQMSEEERIDAAVARTAIDNARTQFLAQKYGTQEEYQEVEYLLRKMQENSVEAEKTSTIYLEQMKTLGLSADTLERIVALRKEDRDVTKEVTDLIAQELKESQNAMTGVFGSNYLSTPLTREDIEGSKAHKDATGFDLARAINRTGKGKANFSRVMSTDLNKNQRETLNSWLAPFDEKFSGIDTTSKAFKTQIEGLKERERQLVTEWIESFKKSIQQIKNALGVDSNTGIINAGDLTGISDEQKKVINKAYQQASNAALQLVTGWSSVNTDHAHNKGITVSYIGEDGKDVAGNQKRTSSSDRIAAFGQGLMGISQREYALMEASLHNEKIAAIYKEETDAKQKLNNINEKLTESEKSLNDIKNKEIVTAEKARGNAAKGLSDNSLRKDNIDIEILNLRRNKVDIRNQAEQKKSDIQQAIDAQKELNQLRDKEVQTQTKLNIVQQMTKDTEQKILDKEKEKEDLLQKQSGLDKTSAEYKAIEDKIQDIQKSTQEWSDTISTNTKKAAEYAEELKKIQQQQQKQNDIIKNSNVSDNLKYKRKNNKGSQKGDININAADREIAKIEKELRQEEKKIEEEILKLTKEKEKVIKKINKATQDLHQSDEKIKALKEKQAQLEEQIANKIIKQKETREKYNDLQNKSNNAMGEEAKLADDAVNSKEAQLQLERDLIKSQLAGLQAAYRQRQTVQATVNALAGGFSSLTMSISSLSTLMKTVTDNSLGVSDRIGQFIMQFGFSAPMIIRGVNQLSDGLLTLKKNSDLVRQARQLEISLGKKYVEISSEEVAVMQMSDTVRKQHNITIDDATLKTTLNKAVTEAGTKATVEDITAKLVAKNMNEQFARSLATAYVENEKLKTSMSSSKPTLNVYIAIIMAIIAVLSAVSNSIKNAAQARKDAAKQQVSLTVDEMKEQIQISNTTSEYLKYASALEIAKVKGQDLEDIQSKMIETAKSLGDETLNQAAKVAELTGNYDDLTRKIEEAQKAAANQSYDKTSKALQNAIAASTGSGKIPNFNSNNLSYTMDITPKSDLKFGDVAGEIFSAMNIVPDLVNQGLFGDKFIQNTYSRSAHVRTMYEAFKNNSNLKTDEKGNLDVSLFNLIQTRDELLNYASGEMGGWKDFKSTLQELNDIISNMGGEEGVQEAIKNANFNRLDNALQERLNGRNVNEFGIKEWIALQEEMVGENPEDVSQNDFLSWLKSRSDQGAENLALYSSIDEKLKYADPKIKEYILDHFTEEEFGKGLAINAFLKINKNTTEDEVDKIKEDINRRLDESPILIKAAVTLSSKLDGKTNITEDDWGKLVKKYKYLDGTDLTDIVDLETFNAMSLRGQLGLLEDITRAQAALNLETYKGYEASQEYDIKKEKELNEKKDMLDKDIEEQEKRVQEQQKFIHELKNEMNVTETGNSLDLDFSKVIENGGQYGRNRTDGLDAFKENMETLEQGREAILEKNISFDEFIKNQESWINQDLLARIANDSEYAEKVAQHFEAYKKGTIDAEYFTKELMAGVLTNIDVYKNYETTLTNANNVLEEATKKLQDYEQELSDVNDEIRVLPNIEDFFSKNNQLYQDLINQTELIIKENQHIADGVALVGENYIVASDKAAEFARVYPELLEGAQIYTDGTIHLDQEVYQSKLETLKGIRKAETQQRVDVLLEQMKILKIKIDYAREQRNIAAQVLNGTMSDEEAKTKILASTEEYANKLQEYIGKEEAERLVQSVKNNGAACESIIDYLDSVAKQAQMTGYAISAALSEGTYDYTGKITLNAEGLEKIGEYNKTNGKTFKEKLEEYQKDGKEARDAAWAMYYKEQDTQLSIYEKTYGIMNSEVVQLQKTLWDIDHSKTKDSKKKNKDLEIERDLYHDINIELKKQETIMSRLQKLQDHLVGQKALDNLNKQLAFLDAQNNALERKRDIMAQDIADRKADLIQEGIEFDEKDEITNFEDMQKKYADAYKAAIDAGNTTTAENIKNNYDKLIKAIDKYEDLRYEQWDEIIDTIEEHTREKMEIEIKKIDIKIEAALNITEANKALLDFANDFDKRISKSFKGATIDANTAIGKFKEDHQEVVIGDSIGKFLLSNNPEDRAQLEKMYGKNYDDVNEGSAEYFERLKSTKDDVISYMKELGSDIDNMQSAAEKMVDNLTTAFEKEREIAEAVNSTIDHSMKLVDLLKGEDAYAEKTAYYAQKVEYNINKLENLNKEKADLENIIQDALRTGNDEVYEKARDKWLNVVKDVQSTTESAIQNIQAKLENSVNAAWKKIEDKMTNGFGFDYVLSQWNLMNESADRYLDTVNATYGVQKVQSKYLKAIDKYDGNVPVQQKLNKLMKEEIAYLEKKDKLSQYDIDRALKKYEIAVKQAELEDAQDSKTALRLRRDNQGNYSYQFVANDEDVDDKQDELNDATNDLYNFDKDRYKELMSDITNYYKKFGEEMNKVNTDITLTEEQREKKRVDLTKYYGDIINGIVADNQDVLKNLNESTFLAFATMYQTNAESFEEMTGLNQENFEKMVGQSWDSWSNLTVFMSGNWRDLAVDISAVDDYFAESFGTMVDEMAKKMYDDPDYAFLPQVKLYTDECTTALQDYEKEIKLTEEAAQESFDNITKNGYNPMIDAVNKLLDRQTALREEIERENENELPALLENIQNLKSEYELLGRTITSTLNALTNAWKKYNQAVIKAKESAQDAVGPNDITDYDKGKVNGGDGSETGTPVGTGEEPKKKKTPQNIAYLVLRGTNVWATRNGELDPSITKISDDPNAIVDFKQSYFTGTKLLEDMERRGEFEKIFSHYKLVDQSSASPQGIVSLIQQMQYQTLKSSNPAAIVRMDTGGYTGEWGKEGRLAMLHEKELVLNAHDTENMLNMTKIMHEIIANAGVSAQNNMSKVMSVGDAIMGEANTGTLEQNVHILVECPNITDPYQLQEVLLDLPNVASQQAYRTK